MSKSIYNVLPTAPTEPPPEWSEMESKWRALGAEWAIDERFLPLTVKLLYATGLILAFCNTVTILLRKGELHSTTYLPAYTVFSSSIDLLGRCLNGDYTWWHPTDDLRAGFQWLAHPSEADFAHVPDDRELVRTTNFAHTIADLIAMRHFAAHGQATSQAELRQLDYLLLAEMPALVAEAMKAYLSQLRSSELLTNRLAQASIRPYRNRPVFDALWGSDALPDRYPVTIAETLAGMDWSYKLAPPF